MDFAVYVMHKAVARGVRVRPARDHGQLYKAGKHRGDGRAAHFQPREAHAAENQEIIEREIDQNGRHARHHGHDGLPGFAQRTGIHLHDHKGEQAPQHYAHIVQAVLQRGFDVRRGAALVQVEADERLGKGHQNADGQHGQPRAEQQLELKGAAQTVGIAAAIKLRAKDARARRRAKNAQVENEKQLVGDGHAAHRLRAQLAHHNVIQHGNEVRNAILRHNG